MASGVKKSPVKLRPLLPASGSQVQYIVPRCWAPPSDDSVGDLEACYPVHAGRRLIRFVAPWLQMLFPQFKHLSYGSSESAPSPQLGLVVRTNTMGILFAC